jgi:hypothetical protein
MPDRNKSREEIFILLTASEISVHYGREGVVEQLKL